MRLEHDLCSLHAGGGEIRMGQRNRDLESRIENRETIIGIRVANLILSNGNEVNGNMEQGNGNKE